MSDKRKESPEFQEDSSSTKKLCIDLPLHNDSSISNFTWIENSSSESSAWQILYETPRKETETGISDQKVDAKEPKRFFETISGTCLSDSSETLTPESSHSEHYSESSHSEASLKTFDTKFSGAITPSESYDSLRNQLYLSSSESTCSSGDQHKFKTSSSSSYTASYCEATEREPVTQKLAGFLSEEPNERQEAGDDRKELRTGTKVKSAKANPLFLYSDYEESDSEYEVSDKSTQCTGISPLNRNTVANREAFVMKIMKTFKSNSLYDAFCYTLPRSLKSVQNFQGVLFEILSLADQCRFGLVKSTTENFPLQESKDLAEDIIRDMRKRYTKMKDETNSSDSSLSESLEKEVDNDLPSSLVYLISDGFVDIVPTWSGQFQACVNPVTNVISLLMFEYIPAFPMYNLPAFSSKLVTEELCNEIFSRMEQFECSRQFRMDVDLSGIDTLSFFKISDTEGLLFIKIETPARFMQRFVNCSAIDRNEWHKREPFLPFKKLCYKNYVLALGGVTSEISNIAAHITAASPNIKINKESVADLILDTKQPSDEESGFKKTPKSLSARAKHKIRISLERRHSMLDKLCEHKIITEDQKIELKTNIILYETNTKKGIECNYIYSENWHPCFLDFLNYGCTTTSELEHQLSKRCNISEKMVDTELHKYDPETQNTTVGEYLVGNKSSKHYYSFCIGDLVSTKTWHCSVCGKCNSENEWHCPGCEKCTKANDICEYCGFSENGYIILPGSANGKAQIDLKVNPSIADTPDWSTTLSRSFKTDKAPFNLNDFTQDELGLIDPMAFLLGSEARGSGNRQGRCRQKYKKHVEGNPKMLAAAGCVIS